MFINMLVIVYLRMYVKKAHILQWIVLLGVIRKNYFIGRWKNFKERAVEQKVGGWFAKIFAPLHNFELATPLDRTVRANFVHRESKYGYWTRSNSVLYSIAYCCNEEENKRDEFWGAPGTLGKRHDVEKSFCEHRERIVAVRNFPRLRFLRNSSQITSSRGVIFVIKVYFGFPPPPNFRTKNAGFVFFFGNCMSIS